MCWAHIQSQKKLNGSGSWKKKNERTEEWKKKQPNTHTTKMKINHCVPCLNKIYKVFFFFFWFYCWCCFVKNYVRRIQSFFNKSTQHTTKDGRIVYLYRKPNIVQHSIWMLFYVLFCFVSFFVYYKSQNISSNRERFSLYVLCVIFCSLSSWSLFIFWCNKPFFASLLSSYFSLTLPCYSDFIRFLFGRYRQRKLLAF